MDFHTLSTYILAVNLPCPVCHGRAGLVIDAYDLEDCVALQALPFSGECWDCGALVESTLPLAKVNETTKLEVL